jgi:hypothetical protein
MFLANRKPTFTAALAVLSIALPFGNLAFAQSDSSATIAYAERAAQSVIVDLPSRTHSLVAMSAASSEVTLAQNERAAQRAIVDAPLGATELAGHRNTIGGASLAQAERAAQQAIAGASIEPRVYSTAHAVSSIGQATHASDEASSRGN